MANCQGYAIINWPKSKLLSNIQNIVVDGGWSAWSNWTVCNQTCGTGLSFRTRNCSNPAPKYGGYPCYGEKEESATCPEDKNIPECKNTCVLNCCQGNEYLNEANRICRLNIKFIFT